jgi:hypothetical protein
MKYHRNCAMRAATLLIASFPLVIWKRFLSGSPQMIVAGKGLGLE